jgi:predicted nucleic acid-binding protein
VTKSPRCIVVTDANVLINLIHVSRLDLCAKLPGYEFVVPDHVNEEISNLAHRKSLDAALERGIFQVESITDPDDIRLFADLTQRLGKGEAACLVLAVRHGWILASDEKRRFRREAESRIGEDRIIGTAELFVLAIRQGVLTVEEADADKAMLEVRRFRMPFTSFRELVT